MATVFSPWGNSTNHYRFGGRIGPLGTYQFSGRGILQTQKRCVFINLGRTRFVQIRKRIFGIESFIHYRVLIERSEFGNFPLNVAHELLGADHRIIGRLPIQSLQ